ncbi:MAG: phage replisome organizer N-terminal domain-containing protein [Clostridium sp.]|uniref:phage replisome organizer N-terminal domain-containing protein n=1 Tax=Clostridium sp. TaxID=1506 RepID=UPI00290D6A9F|nr:phage replisome organizer N-terminal domain-containing protein [Clostridium sp.]MDU7339313.1 phage replisome organizer N-terminal domain-containing protein [Clostridium sp.]
MAEVKWIKIVTDVFDDQKIRFIETLPNGDAIVVIWFKLLCLAGKSNANGFLMMTDKIAYTDEILASVFDRDIKLIQLSLSTFQKLDMIEIIDNKIYLSNWEKHQSAEKLSEIREQGRIRQAKRREKLKSNANSVTLALPERDCNIDVTQQNKKENIDKETDSIPPIFPKGIDARFSKFWDAYPKKVGKGAAEKAFKKYKPDDCLLDKMLSALSAQKKSDQWQKEGGQFVPYPTTWLNQKRWEDEAECSSVQGNSDYDSWGGIRRL